MHLMNYIYEAGYCCEGVTINVWGESVMVCGMSVIVCGVSVMVWGPCIRCEV